jgi:hypothetical protein
MLVPALVAACSAGAEGIGSQDSEQHVDPQGNDNPGSILVKLPDGATAIADSTYTLTGQNQKVSVGTPISNLSVGSKSLSLTSGWLGTSTNVGVSAGQTTTVTTALLGLKNSDGPRTWGLDPSTFNVHVRDHGNSPFAFADGTGRAALFEGAYNIDWGFLDGTSIALAAGDNKVVDLKEITDRRITRVKTTKGDYPTACNGKNAFSLGWRPPYVGGWPNSYSSWDGNEIDLGISAQNAGYKYVHAVYNDIWPQWIDMPSGEPGAGPLVWTIGVIDIDDVLINQGQPRVKGTWQVFGADPKTGQRDGNAPLLTCVPPTGTGAPLPPGHYRVEVYYNTVEAGQKTDVHIIDI